MFCHVFFSHILSIYDTDMHSSHIQFTSHIQSTPHIHTDTCISKIVVEHNVQTGIHIFWVATTFILHLLFIFRFLGLETAHGAPDAPSTPLHLELREELAAAPFEAPGPSAAAEDDKRLGMAKMVGDQRQMQHSI